MNTFASASATAEPPTTPLDLTKRVNYTLGMVLGKSDFETAHAYLSGHDRWLARDLSGYGTVWGLGVRIEDDEGGPRVNVAPGTAVTPCGRLVCVSPAQCARLNEWLAAHEQDVPQPLVSSPPTVLRLYVVLCHRECPTDNLPIPGEPCRTEDRLTAPSRIKDDFRLELRTTPPAQREEDAIRDFVAWLRAIPVVDGPASELEELLDEIKKAASAAVAALESPPSSPPSSPPESPYDFVIDSPPAYLAIPSDHAAEYLRAAFSLWVTELRAELRNALPGCECGCEGTGSCGCGCHSASGKPEDECDDDVVLLAALEVPVVQTLSGDIEVADSGWEVDDTRRPYVLHTRFLQEWLLSEGLRQGEGSPPLLSPPDLPNPISIISAHQVAGGPTADWDPTSGSLDLGIPAGAGIDTVAVAPKAAGHQPNVESFAGGVLTLGMGPGAQGIQGIQGIEGTPGLPGTSFVVAAGRFGPLGGHDWATKRMKATPVPGLRRVFHIRFDGFSLDGKYLIKGTTIIRALDEPRLHTFEVLDVDDRLKALVENLGDPQIDIETGFFARVLASDLDSGPRGFMVEVSEYPEAS